MSRNETILSAGIDIGTSTTKLIISRFTLQNMAGSTLAPRVEIIDKEILYYSPIYRTPLLSTTKIDLPAVVNLVQKEYQEAAVDKSEIKTGAVIITGETATKENAEETVQHLSDIAGEFLVATAGPDLEGIIAAKGSGAVAYAKKTGKTVGNVDIGGGTANIAVYKGEHLQGTCTLHVGGRLIEFTKDKISNISKPIQEMIALYKWNLQVGDSKNNPIIQKVVQLLAETVIRALSKRLLPEDDVLLLGHSPEWEGKIDTVIISGGVSECMFKLEKASYMPDEYDDIGVALAKALSRKSRENLFEWIIPEETVRATVLGAGTQTTSISGSTIHVKSSDLPQKNLPVFEVAFENDLNIGLEKIKTSMEEANLIYDPQAEGQNIAIYLTDTPYMNFSDIQAIAKALLTYHQSKVKSEQALVIILQSDLAKVIGQTINTYDANQSVICIDQIKVEHGDYVDVGQILDSGVVPVVIKTLTFHSS